MLQGPQPLPSVPCSRLSHCPHMTLSVGSTCSAHTPPQIFPGFFPLSQVNTNTLVFASVPCGSHPEWFWLEQSAWALSVCAHFHNHPCGPLFYA